MTRPRTPSAPLGRDAGRYLLPGEKAVVNQRRHWAALVRPGGRIANIGVHGVPVELPMQDLWIQNVTLSMGLVDTTSIPTLLRMVAGGRIPAEKMGTHRFTFGEIDRAYEVFADAAAHEALKVVITP